MEKRQSLAPAFDFGRFARMIAAMQHREPLSRIGWSENSWQVTESISTRTCGYTLHGVPLRYATAVEDALGASAPLRVLAIPGECTRHKPCDWAWISSGQLVIH